MAARLFLAVLMNVLSAPLVALSRVAARFDAFHLRRDVIACLSVIDETDAMPRAFIVALRAAEDHRNKLHPGIDPLAVLRAACVRVLSGEIQGASTIEQQFVRVVTGRYEKTARRKLREQLVAIAVSGQRSKDQIASAYLAIAFYGSGRIGLRAIRKKCGSDLDCASAADIRGMVARLKYPEPLSASPQWLARVERRVSYIARRSSLAQRMSGDSSQKSPLGTAIAQVPASAAQ